MRISSFTHWTLAIALVAMSGQSYAAKARKTPVPKKEGKHAMEKIVKTDAQWKAELSPEAYDVLRHQGTERPFSGKYWNSSAHGIYHCGACDTELFASDGKFESMCGWPSFFKGLHKDAIVERVDKAHGMERTEVVCARCGSHLGHVFNDGPAPTGLRYCINSVSLKFVADAKAKP